MLNSLPISKTRLSRRKLHAAGGTMFEALEERRMLALLGINLSIPENYPRLSTQTPGLVNYATAPKAFDTTSTLVAIQYTSSPSTLVFLTDPQPAEGLQLHLLVDNSGNLIGGQWLPAQSGKTFLNINPADHSDIVGEFPDSAAADVDLAVAAAKKAYATWRLVPAPKRAEILFRAALLLSERKEQFAREMIKRARQANESPDVLVPHTPK